MSRFSRRLASMLVALTAPIAPRAVLGANCPPAGCEFSSTTVSTTTTTLPAEQAWLQALIDDMQEVTLPFSGAVVLRGTASAGGRLRARIWSSSPSHPDSALLAKGRVRVRRPGAFKLKLHPTPVGRRLSSGILQFEVQHRTSAGIERRSNVVYPWGPGPFCCDFGTGGACRGGFEVDACERQLGLLNYPGGATCDASGDCVRSPGTSGSCCDNVPSQPGVCGAPADASACAGAGGTFHPAAVCQPSGVCSP